jgi:quinol-cytochrome oxidoreductase complex cytochrome b subunit
MKEEKDFWGATLITSLASVRPVVGDTIVRWLLGRVLYFAMSELGLKGRLAWV